MPHGEPAVLVTSVSQMRTLKLRKENTLLQGCTASERQAKHLILNLVSFEAPSIAPVYWLYKATFEEFGEAYHTGG